MYSLKLLKPSAKGSVAVSGIVSLGLAAGSGTLTSDEAGSDEIVFSCEVAVSTS